MSLSYISDLNYAGEENRTDTMRQINMMLPVEDLDVSRNFYETILEQKVQYDFGDTLVFECGIMLCEKTDFANTVCQDVNTIKRQANNMLIRIEKADIGRFESFLDSHPDIRVLQRQVEYPRGQRAIRIYDPDWNIVEIVETMQTMMKRFVLEGLTPEAASVKSEYPMETVQQCYSELSSVG